MLPNAEPFAEEMAEKAALKVKEHKDAWRKGFLEWLKTKEPLGKLFDTNLYVRAYKVHQDLHNNDTDHMTVFVGKEGIGKSTIAIQFCSVVSPSFKMSNVCFSSIEYIDGLRVAIKGDGFLMDEGALFLFSGDAKSSGSNLTKKALTVIRYKNLHTAVCIPSLNILDSYVKEHRVHTLIHVRARGKYIAYTGEAIKIIADLIRKNAKWNINSVKVPKGSFWRGHFNKIIPEINDITEQNYKEHKAANVNKFLDEISDKLKEQNTSRYVNIKQALQIIPVSRNTLMKMLKESKLKGINTGNKWLISRESLEKLASEPV